MVRFGPWAHPAWDDYLLSLCDLTTRMEGHLPIKYARDATHELMVWALDPREQVNVAGDEWHSWELGPALMTPANHGYQFAAPSHEAAYERVERIARLVENVRLSPDTDHNWVRAWDALFSDGVSLRRRHRFQEGSA